MAKNAALPSHLPRQVMVIQDLLTRANSILGFLRIILILISNQLLLQGTIKERELTVEEISNHLHHRQVILVVIQTQTLVTMTTITIMEETMGGAEEADVWNVTLKDRHFLEIHLPIQEAY